MIQHKNVLGVDLRHISHVVALAMVLPVGALTVGFSQQHQLYINGTVESSAVSAGGAGSGPGIGYRGGGVESRTEQQISSPLTEITSGYYTWSTASAIAMGSGFWPEEPSGWVGNGSYLCRTDGVRQLLVTGALSHRDAPRIEQSVLSQSTGHAYFAYTTGEAGPAVCSSGGHYGEFEAVIPFRVSVNTTAILALGQATNYTATRSAGYVDIVLEEMPPVTIAVIEFYNPVRDMWELVGGVFYRARMDGYQGPGRYTDISPTVQNTVFLQTGVQYRLRINQGGIVSIFALADARSLSQSGSGGFGSSIMLILNRSSVPPSVTLEDIRADIDASGTVDDSDLLLMLSAFGASGSSLPADVNSDGAVDDGDLLHILTRYGLSY